MRKNLLLILTALLLPCALQAQHVQATVGNGTSEDYTIPFCNYYNNGTTQQIYSHEEINQAGYIDTIWFYSATTNTLVVNSLKIYLGTTNQTTLSSMLPASDFTEVYSATAVTLGGMVGWQPFVLEEPFYYEGTVNDGASNLVVAVCKQSNSYNGQVRYMCHGAGSNQVRYRQNDNEAFYGDINCTYYSQSSSYRANLRLSIDQNYTPPACAKPIRLNVEDIYGPNATISWHEAGTSTAWMVEYGPTPFTLGSSANTIVVVTDTTATLSGSPLTQYTAAVYALCNNGDTSQCNTITFTTGCAVIDSLPFVQDFESAPTGSSTNANFIPCWSHLNDARSSYKGYPFVTGTYAPYNHTPGGSKALIWNNANFGTHQCIALPSVDNSIPINNLQLKFWAYANQPTMPIHLQVGVMNDPDDFSTFTPAYTLTISNTSWTEYACPLSSYTGNGRYVAISAMSGNIWSGPLDDFTLDWLELCPQTSELSVTDSTASSISLTWTEYGAATSWVIEYDTVDFVPGTNSGTVTIATTIPYTLTGLDSAHTYYIYLHADCGGDTSRNRFITASTMAASPTHLPYSCDFEQSGCNGWAFMNGDQSNAWCVGNATHYGSGSRSLYISNDGGLSNVYDTLSPGRNQTNYTYRTLIFDDTAEYLVSFDWRANGESNYDYLRAYLVPSHVQFIPGQMPDGAYGTSSLTSTTPQGWICADGGEKLNLSSSWQNAINAVQVPAGTYHLVFFWCSDHSGGEMPPAAIDNVYVGLNTCPAVTNLRATHVSGDTITLEWQTRGYEQLWTVSDGSSWHLTTDTTYTFTHIHPNSAYHFAVRAICDAGDTSLAVRTTVRSACGLIGQLPFAEDFEYCEEGSSTDTTFVPCWGHCNNATTRFGYPYVAANNASNHTSGGNHGLLWYSSSSSSYADYYTISLPAVDLDSFDVADLMVSFWARVPNAGYSATLQVGVMNNTSSINTFVLVDSVVITGTSEWQHFDVPLEGYTGTGNYITLRLNRTDGYVSCFTDDFVLDLTPTCARPSGLHITHLGTYDVTLAWNGNAGQYEVEYGPAGFAPGNGTSLFVQGDTTVTVTGLTDNSGYVVRVRAICNTGDTSLWTACNFTTRCAYLELPFFEDFENEPVQYSGSADFMDCWTRLSDATTGYYPFIGSSAGYSHNGGNKGIYWYNGVGASYGDYKCVVLPPIDPATPASTLQLDFWAKANTSSSLPVFQVGVMTDPDDIATFVCIDNITVTSGSNWNFFEVPLNTYSGNGQYVAIRTTRPVETWTGYIDEISLHLLPSCPKVTHFSLAGADPNTLDIAFTDPTPGIGWEYEYGPEGFAQGTGTLGFTTATNFVVTDLIPLTTYDIYVRHICSSTDTGAWSQFHATTTLCDSTEIATTYSNSTAAATYTSFFPGYSTYNYSYSETLIDSADLSGLTSINAFAFQPHTTYAGSYFTNCDVYLGHTSAGRYQHDSTATTGPLFDSTFVLVYSGSLNYATTDWQTFTFDTVFDYDGHSNLVLVVNRKHGTYVSGSSFNAHATADCKAICAYRDNAAFVPGQMDNVNIVYSNDRADYKLFSCINSCAKPSLITATTSYASATVGWNGTGDSYEAEIRSNGDYSEPIAISGTSHTFTGLMPATQYTVRLRQRCDEEFTSGWRIITFVTDTLICTAPTNLSIEEVTHATVTLDWSAHESQSSWTVRIFNTTFDSSYTVTSHPFTITGLLAGRTYNAAVSGNCLGLFESDYSDILQFTTEACDQVSNVTATVDGHTATIAWTNGANNNGTWQLLYGEAGEVTTDDTPITVTSNPYTLSNLEAGDYEVYVQAVCGEGWFSGWSDNAHTTFTVTSEGVADVEGSLHVAIHPNPASNVTTVSLSGVNGEVTIAVVDMNGRTVQHSTMECAGDCVKKLEVRDLAQGAYFVRIYGESVNTVKKLIVK